MSDTTPVESIITDDFAVTPTQFSQAKTIAGHPVSVASLQNERESNDDRAAVVSLENVPSERLDTVAEEAMKESEKKVDAIWNAKERGGCTSTIGIYDPRNFRLFIRSRGDSPAYIVLHDGAHAVALRVTSPIDGVGSTMFHSMQPVREPAHGPVVCLEPDTPQMSYDLALAEYKKNHPGVDLSKGANKDIKKTLAVLAQHARYRAHKRIYYPKKSAADEYAPLGLNQLIDKVAADKRLGMNDPSKIQATLVVMSDGLERGFDIQHAVPNDLFAWVVMKGMRSGTVANPAEALVQASESRQGTTDNTTAIVIPLVKETHKEFGKLVHKGCGGPLAFNVADGFKTHGGSFAQASVTGFTEAMERAQKEAQAAWLKRRDAAFENLPHDSVNEYEVREGKEPSLPWLERAIQEAEEKGKLSPGKGQ